MHAKIFSTGMLLAITCQTALAWSQRGHMVMGAIAYEELRTRDPNAIERIVNLMAQHPDRGTFEVALGDSTGGPRSLRLFMEMARWPDDVRKGMFDHPTWHYASRPLLDADHPPPLKPRDVPAGSANEAFALNLSIASDTRAPAAERAVALCWVFHLVGDIHQPLHAADEYSKDYPNGDRGGGLQYVLDPQSRQPVSLHWFWDLAASRSNDDPSALAATLHAKFPRRQLAELAQAYDPAQGFEAWGTESYAIARSQAYRPDLSTGSDEAKAPALSPAYSANGVSVAERRLTLSGYRLSDLLIAVLRE